MRLSRNNCHAHSQRTSRVSSHKIHIVKFYFLIYRRAPCLLVTDVAGTHERPRPPVAAGFLGRRRKNGENMFAAGRFTLAGGARSRLPPSFPRVTLASGATGTTACVSEDGGAVVLKFGGESSADRYVFPAVFLRDNCSRSVHPTTLQRTVPVWELPHDLAIQSALPDDAAETVTVCWNDAADAGTGAGAGHEGSGGAAAGPAAAGLPSTFSYSWLKAHRLDPGADGAHSKMGNQAEALELQPWRPAELPDGPGILPSFEYAGVMSSDDELLRLLDAIATLGVARITAMEPGDADGGLKLAQRIGHGRATVFGDHFEVKVEAVPNNQAYTSDGAQRNAYLFIVMYRGEFLLFLFVVCLLFVVQVVLCFFCRGEGVELLGRKGWDDKC